MSELRETEDEASIKKEWSLYLIRCKDDSLYCGITNDVERRFQEHQNMGKKTAKYLRGRGPLKMVFNKIVGNYSQALKIELRFKALSKLDKEQVVLKQSLNIIES